MIYMYGNVTVVGKKKCSQKYHIFFVVMIVFAILFLITTILLSFMARTASGLDMRQTLLDEIARNRLNPDVLLTQHTGGVLAAERRVIESRAFSVLEQGLKKSLEDNVTEINANNLPDPFQYMHVSLAVAKSYIHDTDGNGNDEKYFVGKDYIWKSGKEYKVYAAGIAGQPVFENYMSTQLRADVYGFDCTDHQRWNYEFHFYPWCIGKGGSFEGSQYAHGINEGQQFYSLKQIKEKLNHKKIDMLKMDIEGFEWDLIQNEIIEGDDADLPEQLLFEMHTEGANEKWVPPHNVRGKKVLEATLLVYRLWFRGYRLIHIEVNNGDPRCAELAFLRVVPHHSHDA